MILLFRGEDEINRVRERGMRDVMQQARHLFAAQGPSAASARQRRPGYARNAVTSLKGNARAEGPACLTPFNR